MKPGSTACEHNEDPFACWLCRNDRIVAQIDGKAQMPEKSELEELKEKLAVAVEALERVKAPLTDAEIDCVVDTSSEERFAMRNWTRKKIAREALAKIGELK